jgi:hypothetical protein
LTRQNWLQLFLKIQYWAQLFLTRQHWFSCHQNSDTIWNPNCVVFQDIRL